MHYSWLVLMACRTFSLGSSDGIKSTYTVQGNIGIDGAKFGTTFGSQLLVIDKTGATMQDVLTGNVMSVEELLALLERIRNDRQTPTQADSISEPITTEPLTYCAGPR